MPVDVVVQRREVTAVEESCAVAGEFVEHAGEHFLQRLSASCQQPVNVTPLRHPSPVSSSLRQHVALHDGDVLVEVGQRPRGQQARHARSQDHCVATDFRHCAPTSVAWL